MPPLRIFISYGRDQYAPLAARLAADLTAKGYEVWYDQQLQSGTRWEEVIQTQIDRLAEIPGQGRFIYLLTPHSARNGSFCRKELRYALDLNIPVFTLLVADCRPPLSVNDFQHIDFRPVLAGEQNEEVYQHLLEMLVADMEGSIGKNLHEHKNYEGKTNSKPRKNPKSSLLHWVNRSRLIWLVALIIFLTTIGIVSQNQPLLYWLGVTPNPKPPACISIGQTWTSPIDGMTLVCVPGGEFLMGSLDTDKDVPSTEKPQHSVFLDAYWIDRTEVTNAMFRKFAAANPDYRTQAEKKGRGNVYDANKKGLEEIQGADWRHPSGSDSSLNGLDNHPVVQVSWEDAKEYCSWVGGHLPTEAQWEKAARSTDTRKYPWGEVKPSSSLANYGMNMGTTTVAGSYPEGQSPYGLLDLAGNVWEWTSDFYSSDYYSKSVLINPTGPTSGNNRVVRGGSWYYEDWSLRVTFRGSDNPIFVGVGQGFRCVR